MKVLMLSQADVRELLDLDRLLDALEEDLAAAGLVYRAAVARGAGAPFEL